MNDLFEHFEKIFSLVSLRLHDVTLKQKGAIRSAAQSVAACVGSYVL